MGWTSFQLVIAVTLLITGSLNTLSTKWADTMYAVGIDKGEPRPFNHPFVQAVGMFIGEWACMVVFQILRRTKKIELGNQFFNPLILLPPALCDMTATSIMYVGLNLTYASSFQMLRGAVMVFVALFSVIFLRRVIQNHMWLGICTVVLGLAAVGIADMTFGNEDKSDQNGIISGDLLIIMSQIVAAVQFVYEEKYVNKHNIPALQVVGWEGFFGFVVLGILLLPMYYIPIGPPFSTDPDGRMENAPDAFVQMANNNLIIVAFLGNMVSIAFFNFAGVSVTKELSATTRMVLDSARTLIIWVFSLAIGWQPFIWSMFLIQIAGFVLLLMGMCIYNDIVFSSCLRKYDCLYPVYEAPLRGDPVMEDATLEKTPLVSSKHVNRAYQTDTSNTC